MCPTLRKYVSTSFEGVGNFLYLGKVRPESVREMDTCRKYHRTATCVRVCPCVYE